ncbi:hypothetical protein [Pseudomonas aeruginosa]|uniref:hypothetical protein n=1 Tax=Pseudomonas aeruginosa TaxID=287 RepID=UPI00115E54FB|nr:hypothetical protein [Pseudomonas aeruginosa]MBA5003785.1 hypothetical protein [Pseudomonas aeruginosa]HCF5250240.1 hypothetical protein [Pseudomonas aeruginosa]HCI2855705.1 hypothetical protein [Pseudomonas aeruginosa]HCL3989471.1 hypothetical protein [Pseudomonas aeruginosa]HEJ4861964.1 hypothetical protein [Pseudomonas aeruginosa]
MFPRFRDDLPTYSNFFRTEYDEQNDVGALEAHYSVLSVPLFEEPNSRIDLQRIAVIWDSDHDQRVIDILEAAYFQGLLSPVLYIAEHKGAVSVIINETLNQPQKNRQNRLWQQISDEVIDNDKFKVHLMSKEEFIETLKDRLQPAFRNYLVHINDAWDLGPHIYVAPKASERRPRRRSPIFRSDKRSW